MNDQNIYQHFSSSDKEFIDQALDLVAQVEERYAPLVTRFLDPHQARILETLANRAGVSYFSSSILAEMELVKVILAPDYYILDEKDFELALLEIDYARKFNTLSHGQILGTLLNRLGIERSVFGDIILSQERAQIFVEEKFVTFFTDNITKIAKVPVKLRQIPLTEKLPTEVKSSQKDILVSSLRLDKVLSATFKLSRADAASMIQKNKVKVNYRPVERVDLQLSLSDLVSVRGFGRFQIIADNGLSKNDKHKLTVEIIASK